MGSEVNRVLVSLSVIALPPQVQHNVNDFCNLHLPWFQSWQRHRWPAGMQQPGRGRSLQPSTVRCSLFLLESVMLSRRLLENVCWLRYMQTRFCSVYLIQHTLLQRERQ